MPEPVTLCPNHSGIENELKHSVTDRAALWEGHRQITATLGAIQQSAALINQRLEQHIKDTETDAKMGFVGSAKQIFFELVKLGVIAGVVWIAAEMGKR